jgi:hypothetical protein
MGQIAQAIIDPFAGLLPPICVARLLVPVLTASSQPKRVAKTYGVITYIGIQIDPARQPDGILGEKAPRRRIICRSSSGMGCAGPMAE